MGTLGMFEVRSTYGQQTGAQTKAVLAAGGFVAIRVAATMSDRTRSAMVFGAVRLLGANVALDLFGVGSTLTFPLSQVYEARPIVEPELRARGVMPAMCDTNRRHVANGALTAFETTPND